MILFIIQLHTKINKDNDEILHDVVKRQTGNDCQCKDGIPGPMGPPGSKGEMGERSPRKKRWSIIIQLQYSTILSCIWNKKLKEIQDLRRKWKKGNKYVHTYT